MFKKLFYCLLCITILPIIGHFKTDQLPIQDHVAYQRQSTDIDKYFNISELRGGSTDNMEANWGKPDIYSETNGFNVSVYLDKRTELWYNPETDLLYAAFVYMPRYVPFDRNNEILQAKILDSIGMNWQPPTERTEWSVNWNYSSSFEQIRIHEIQTNYGYSNSVICIFLQEPIERTF